MSMEEEHYQENMAKEVLVQQMMQTDTGQVMHISENEIKIAGCPCDINWDYFINIFLLQVTLRFPQDFKEVNIFDYQVIPNDTCPLLKTSTVVISCKHQTAKHKAVLKLKDLLYRQDPDPENTDYLYKIIRFNDDNAAESHIRGVIRQFEQWNIKSDHSAVDSLEASKPHMKWQYQPTAEFLRLN